MIDRRSGSAVLRAADRAAPVADGGDAAATRRRVRALMQAAADVNAAQGDGMTALHWAAMHSDAELATLLLYAGANVRATTRLGGYTPLHLASQAGAAPVIEPPGRRAAPTSTRATATGATPLMLAAASGNADAVSVLLEHSARCRTPPSRPTARRR